MAKKILKPKKVVEEVKVEEVKTEIVEGVEEVKPEVVLEPVVEVKKEEPNFEVVVINGKSYKKFSRPDGTTYLEGPI